MQILQLGPYPPPHGGVQANLVAIHELLLRRQIPATVINITRARHGNGNHVYYPKSAWELFKLLLKLRYDIVHLHLGGDVTPRLLALSLICCLMPRAKAVLTFHSGGYPSSSAGCRASRLSLRGFVFRRFDRIIGVNEEIINWFLRIGVSRDRLYLIPPYSLPGTSTGDSDPLPEPLADFFQCHSPVLISVGLLEPEYDLPLQIDVMDDVRQRFSHAGLVIVGSGSAESRLRAQIASKPYANHILLCGDVEHTTALRAISLADLMLRTTHYDGDAVSVREALHFGTPVVASDNGMRPAGVRLIPTGDPSSLLSAIQTALQSSRCGLDLVQPDLRHIEAVLELYSELTAE